MSDSVYAHRFNEPVPRGLALFQEPDGHAALLQSMRSSEQ